jgi:hypothetical protein
MSQEVHYFPQVQWHNCHEKNVDTKHGALLKRYVEEVNNHPRPSFECEPTTKHFHVTPIAIFGSFSFTN